MIVSLGLVLGVGLGLVRYLGAVGCVEGEGCIGGDRREVGRLYEVLVLVGELTLEFDAADMTRGFIACHDGHRDI
jgi:hypothetical protein